MAIYYGVRVTRDNGMDDLLFDYTGKIVFTTTSKTVADNYRDMCEQECNTLYNPVYTVIEVISD